MFSSLIDTCIHVMCVVVVIFRWPIFCQMQIFILKILSQGSDLHETGDQ